MTFNAPPGWPQPPAGWTPPPGWSPDPAWPSAPEDWQFWVDDEPTASGPRSNGPRGARPIRAQRLTSSFAQHFRRAATASTGLWKRATTSSRRHWFFGGAGLGVGMLTGMLITAAATAPQISSTPTASGSDVSWGRAGPTTIETAVEDCGLTSGSGISVGDEGRSVTIQTAGEDSSYGADVFEMVCVLQGLDVPDSVVSRMDSTRALDGRQSGSWDVFDASWGYHPDDGMNLVIEEVG